ncbi:MAG TPA: DUF308 domain-containing protein [Gaiellaceae bacterium]|nr:DUF308 domain-containing protein [Gaiellaceae bacterium]
MDAAPHPGWDRRRLVYGDWTWLVRDGLDVLRLAFIAATIAYAAATEGRPGTPGLAAACAVLLIARIVDLPRWFDFGLVVAMTAIAWGTALTLYGHYGFYDKVVHSVSPLGYAPVLYLALVRLGVLPDPGAAIRQRRIARIFGIFIATLAVGMAVGAGYEDVEWVSDHWLFGTHFVKGVWDTETDLLCDTGGSLAGATFITVWALRGWSSRRRTVVPAPAPRLTPVETAEERLRPKPGSSAATWARRFAALSAAAQGAAAVGAGVLLLALPAPTLRTAGIVFGVALVGYAGFGVVGLLRRGTRAEHRVRIGELAASLVVGTLVLSWPTMSQLALLYAAGASSVIFAIVEAAALATPGRSTRERWLGGVTSVVALVFGVAMLGRPIRSLDAMIALLGLYLCVLGTLRLVRAVRMPSAGRGRRPRESRPGKELP